MARKKKIREEVEEAARESLAEKKAGGPSLSFEKKEDEELFKKIFGKRAR